jgi:hypothetical protein
MSTVAYAPGRRRWLSRVIVVVVVALVLFTALAGFIVEVLWYEEVGLSSVLWRTIGTKIWLGLMFGLLFFGLLYVNLVIARRLRPSVQVIATTIDPVERIREATEPYVRWIMLGGSVLLALIVAFGVGSHWTEYLLWRNADGVTFGNPEPLFDRDPAFYIFHLPWLRFVQGWLFSALIGVTLIVAFAHLVWGGIRPQAPAFADKVTPAARAHLSVLLGLIMLVKAWGYWIGRFDLLTSTRGVVEGASYTEVHAQLPALNFLTLVAIVCAALFFLNVRVKQWALPIVAVALLALFSVLLGTAYPAFIQQFRVKPNEQQLEAPYIEDNIEATQIAFGLNAIEQERREVSGALTAQQLDENRQSVSNIRLWRPSTLQRNIQSFQRVRQYYDFVDVDVDRYPFGTDGQPRVVMLSAREVNPGGIPDPTWQNVHLAYTHGFGAVASLVNTATAEGQPVLTLQDLPPRGDPEMLQPRIYYGESDQVDFIVAGASGELDYEGSPENLPYGGSGGIPLSGFWRQLVFAWNFRDINLLLSRQITDNSRLMIYRDIRERAAKPVPFLAFDADPYLAVVDGQPVWILDAYTGSNGYPYSQQVSALTATNGQLAGTVNYVRNSVKVVVDAYTGAMTYYADLNEPIVQVWSRAFPGLFTPMTDVAPSLRAHFRYPENLFQMQAFQYGAYHVADPTVFYQGRDFWQVASDPTTDTPAERTAPPMSPSYQLIKVPGGATEQFQLVIPFVPVGRQNMVAWMAASSDPADYGDVTMFRFPEGRNIEGPQQVFARINSDPQFSAERTLLGREGSQVLFGDFLVIPIEDSFLYVQPVYVQASQDPPIPELKRVVIVNGSGGDVSVGIDLLDALAEATGGVSGEGPTGDGATTEERIRQLLTRAVEHFEAAEEALRAGDLALYEGELAEAQALVEQANDLASSASEGGATGTPTPTPTASPTPSA